MSTDAPKPRYCFRTTCDDCDRDPEVVRVPPSRTSQPTAHLRAVRP